MDRREFSALLPALFSVLLPEGAAAQETGLPEIVSGVYPPGKQSGSNGHTSHRYLAGILKAGNIQLEMHESVQEAGAVHEPVGKHLHNEIWLVREGLCELTTNGVSRMMHPGDVGICCAGDLHYIRNAGDTQCSYFVVTVGPPEPPTQK
jgi:quercetin dioxygenase-like cupin family protein